MAVSENTRETVLVAVQDQYVYQFNFGVKELESVKVKVDGEVKQYGTDYIIDSAHRRVEFIEEAIEFAGGEQIYIWAETEKKRADFIGDYIKSVTGNDQLDRIIYVLQELARDVDKCTCGLNHEDEHGARYTNAAERAGQPMAFAEDAYQIVPWDWRGALGGIYLEKAKNLSDLDNVETARDNLELGEAALCDVGTEDGEVLPGDYEGLLTPAQKALLVEGGNANGYHYHPMYQMVREKGQPNGYVPLNNNSKIDNIYLPEVEGFVRMQGHAVRDNVPCFYNGDGDIYDSGLKRPLSDFVGVDDEQTLHLKTINCEYNTIQQITLREFHRDAICREITPLTATPQSFPTAEATKIYADTKIALNQIGVDVCPLDENRLVPEAFLPARALGVVFVDENRAVLDTLPLYANIRGDIKNSNKRIPAGDIVGTTDRQSLSNKTIDSDRNTISNLGVQQFKETAIKKDLNEECTDNELATAKAIKEYATAVGGIKYIGEDDATVDAIVIFADTDGNVKDSEKLLPEGDVVGTSDNQELEGKTINCGDDIFGQPINTITGLQYRNFNPASIVQHIGQHQEPEHLLASVAAIKEYGGTFIPLERMPQAYRANGLVAPMTQLQAGGDYYLPFAYIPPLLNLTKFDQDYVVKDLSQPIAGYTDVQVATAKAIKEALSTLQGQLEFENVGDHAEVFKETEVIGDVTHVKFRTLLAGAPIEITQEEDAIKIGLQINVPGGVPTLDQDICLDPNRIRNLTLARFAQDHVVTDLLNPPVPIEQLDNTYVIAAPALYGVLNAPYGLGQLNGQGRLPIRRIARLNFQNATRENAGVYFEVDDHDIYAFRTFKAADGVNFARFSISEDNLNILLTIDANSPGGVVTLDNEAFIVKDLIRNLTVVQFAAGVITEVVDPDSTNGQLPTAKAVYNAIGGAATGFENLGEACGVYKETVNNVARLRSIAGDLPIVASFDEEENEIHISAITNLPNGLVKLSATGKVPTSLISDLTTGNFAAGVVVTDLSAAVDNTKLAGAQAIKDYVAQQGGGLKDLQNLGLGAAVWAGTTQDHYAKVRSIVGINPISSAVSVDGNSIEISLSQTWIDALKTELKGYTDGKVGEAKAELNSRIDVVDAELLNVKARLTAAEGSIVSIQSEVTGLGATVAGVQTELSALAAEVQALGASVAGIEIEVLALQGQIASVTGRVSDLEDALNNYATKNYVDREVESAEQLAEVLADNAEQHAKEYTDTSLANLITSEGGLLTRENNALKTIPIGEAGKVLTVANGQPVWADPSVGPTVTIDWSVYMSTDQSITAAENNVKVNFDTVESATPSPVIFNPDNHILTVPITGDYEITLETALNASTTARHFSMTLYDYTSSAILCTFIAGSPTTATNSFDFCSANTLRIRLTAAHSVGIVFTHDLLSTGSDSFTLKSGQYPPDYKKGRCKWTGRLVKMV